MANAREKGAKARLAQVESCQPTAVSEQNAPTATTAGDETLARVSGECEELRGVCGELRRQCEELEAMLVANEEERAGLHGGLEALAAQKAEAEAEISKMQRRVAELEAEAEARKDTLAQISQPATPTTGRSRASSCNLSGVITPRMSFSDKDVKVDIESLPEDVEY